MPKEETEELNQEEEVSEEESLPEEESEEEESEETPLDEESSEEKTEKTEEPSEYNKERFDGLMSQWQEDRRKMLELEKRMNELKPKEEQTQEDKWLDYLYNKIETKRRMTQAQEDEIAQQELKDTLDTNPGLSKEEVLETALKYGTNLGTAAAILNEIKAVQVTGKKMTQTEINRKIKAGTIGGKPGILLKAGIRPFDAEKDRGKSIKELMREGLKELGIKKE